MTQDPNLQAEINSALSGMAKNDPLQEAMVENQAQNEQHMAESQAQQVNVDNVSTVADKTETTGPSESFKMLRQKAAQIERERDEYARRLKEIETAKQVQQPQQQFDDEDIRIGNEELVEGKHLSQYNKKLKKMEQQLQAYQQQSYQQSAEVRLKTQYTDFDKVVSRDNIEALRIAYPELAQTIGASGDLYNTGVAAYTMIKKLGIDQQEDYKEDVERIQKNAAKPRPLASVSPQQGNSPLAQANAFANGLTPELQKQLMQEMLEARKNR